MLSPGLALVPIVNFLEAHPGVHFFGLNAVNHPLVEGVAWMRLHVHAYERFHYKKITN